MENYLVLIIIAAIVMAASLIPIVVGRRREKEKASAADAGRAASETPSSDADDSAGDASYAPKSSGKSRVVMGMGGKAAKAKVLTPEQAEFKLLLSLPAVERVACGDCGAELPSGASKCPACGLAC